MQHTYHTPNNLPNLIITTKNGKLTNVNWETQINKKIAKKTATNKTTNRDINNHCTDNDQWLINKTCKQLDEYFAKKRTVFDLPLDISVGSTFQQQVWIALLSLDFGTTISYAKLAQMVGNPKAYRACANANGKNPISIIIPCHRVIASSGQIGGYTGGVFIKEYLLALELQ